jgi:uncharacterized protein (TIGR02147 family)
MMARARKPPQPDIFTFVSYTSWLTETFEALQGRDEAVTHRSFSQMCGYKSSGAMALIMSGRRRLSQKAAVRIAEALRLTVGEREHLLLMIELEQAEEFEARARILRKMASARCFAEQWGDTLRAYDFYSRWYLPVVRELVSLADFSEDPAWIQERVHGKLSRKEAREAIDELLRCGYLERAADGRLRQAQAIISTASELHSDVLKQHQREMMRLASEALDSQPRDVRDMRVMTVAISHGQAQRVKARLTQLQKELLDIIQEDEPIEGVYQLNVQWFSLTEPPGEAAPGEVEPDAEEIEA